MAKDENIVDDEKVQKQVFINNIVQEELNKPLESPEDFDPKDNSFLDEVVLLVDSGKINLYKPQTLLNVEIYNSLPLEIQGKADMEAVNLLSSLREIYDLYKNGLSHTYQMQNLVERVRNTKERVEEKKGDIFII